MSGRRQFGAVRRLPSGRWQARYRDVTGRLHTAPATFRTKADAAAHLARVEADITRGDWHDPKLGRTTLTEWERRWWPTTANLRPSTRSRDRQYLDRYVLDVFGGLPVGAIRQPDVAAWVADLSATGLAPATVRKAYQLLGKCLGAAVDAGLIPISPCRRVPLPRIEREEMRFLTPDEVAVLAAAIHPRYRALVLVGAYSGLRIGELAGLRRRRVDLLRDTVDVAEIAVEVRGHLTFGQPKTRAGRRTVRLPRSVSEELRDHLTSWAGAEFGVRLPGAGGRHVARPGMETAVLAPGGDRRGAGPFAPARPPPHGRRVLDRPGRRPQTRVRSRRAHVGVVHPRPLRAPVPRG
jgi:integrase